MLTRGFLCLIKTVLRVLKVSRGVVLHGLTIRPLDEGANEWPGGVNGGPRLTALAGGAGIKHMVDRWLELHESGSYVRLKTGSPDLALR